MTRSLRPWGPREDKELSEFQVELIQLAAQLVGDYILNTYPDMGKNMTAGEANRYAEDAVKRFLEAGKAAIRAGANESAIVTMRPSLTSRTAGGDYGSYAKAYWHLPRLPFVIRNLSTNAVVCICIYCRSTATSTWHPSCCHETFRQMNCMASYHQ